MMQGGPGICITNYFSRYIGHFNGFILSCRNFEEKICEAHQSVHDYCIDFSNSSDDVFVIELLIDESKLLHVQCSADIAVHRRWFIINVGSVYSCRCAVHQQQLLLVNVLLAPRLLASQSSAPKWREGFLRQNFSSMMHV